MRIAVVLVTFNRLKCLKIALEKYENQTVSPAYLVVVNNASTDGTKEYLEQWNKTTDATFERIILHSETNLGGSGGFSLGLEQAMKLDCDYLFLADDDAYAEPDMFEKLEETEKHLLERERVAALCTSVISYGKNDLWHRRRIKKKLFTVTEELIPDSEYRKEYFDLDELSFVGALIKKTVAKEIGLPKKEYFIYYDDTEYSGRIRAKGTIYCVPAAKMNHNATPGVTVGWKDYYGLRNELDYIRLHFSKRYYIGMIVKEYIRRCSILAIVWKKKPKAHRVMFKKAIKASVHMQLGIDDVYKPGVDVNKI